MKGEKLLNALSDVSDEYILESAPGTARSAKLPKARVTAVLAAILVLLLSFGAIAASQGWHEALVDYLGVGSEQMSELSGAAAMPELSVSDKGVTVTVKQTLADRYGVYVVYEVEAPEDFVFEDDVIWGWENLSHEPARPGTSHITGNRILEQEENRRTVLYWIEGKEMGDGSLELHLANLCRFSPDLDHTLLIEGEWSLEWDFEFKDYSMLLCENTPNDASGDIVIEELRISPMSVYIRVRDAECQKNMRPCITFTDGSVIDLWGREDVPVLHVGDTYSIYYMFDELIDLENVLSVRSGDLEFTLE